MSAPQIEMDDPLLDAKNTDELAEILATHPVKAGQTVAGKVTAVGEDGVTIETEHGSATVPHGDAPEAAVDQELQVYVEWIDREGGLHLSVHKAEMLGLWDQLAAARDERRTVRGDVLCEVRGGYSVDVGMKAFLPSHLLGADAASGIELLGQKLDLYVATLDERKGRATLSMNVPEATRVVTEDVFDSLEEGQTVVGRVARITNFGAFVDLGGFDGLLHVNDLSWGRVKHPRDVVHVGEEVVVKVLKVDEDDRKVALGLKQLAPDPWTVAAERYPVDTKVRGTVISLAQYGAFVEVEPGLEGLVHVSEISWDRVTHPKQALKPGQVVDAVVIRCDPVEQRLKLSIKALLESPWVGVAARYPVGTRLRAKVRNVREFGIFLGIEEGIDGLVHISDLAWGNASRRPGDAFQKGQEVEAMVLEVDVERERMSLGIKQLGEDKTGAFFSEHQPGDVLEGTVRSIADFGAFVEVAENLWGLVHISELRDEQTEHPGDVVEVGQQVKVMILGLDRTAPKISLSMKQAAEPEPEPAVEEPAPAAEEPAAESGASDAEPSEPTEG